ncbi:MAG: gluconokinase [Lysobacterales bacterium]
MVDHQRYSGIVVLGVCGVGKSTVGQLLAATLGWEFVEADGFHSKVAKEKMSRGVGLADNDRGPWLTAINQTLKEQPTQWVLACSALKHRYRETLTDQLPGVALVWLHGNEDLLRLRLRRRESHHAGESLLESQLADLEPPVGCLQLDVVHEPQALVREIVTHLSPGLALKRPVLISDA